MLEDPRERNSLGTDEFNRATPADVVEGLRSAGKGDAIDDRLRRECRTPGRTTDGVLQLSLDAMRDVPD